MLIGWATPFNVRSAIGKFSLFVCDELRARGHDVEIIRIEGGPELHIEPFACKFPIVDAPDCDVRAYDVLVANFGNHAPYHAQILSLIAQRAPLGIFHDIEMRHFEAGMQHRHDVHLPRLPGIDQQLASAGHQDLVDPAARPLLATLAAMTCGAIVHGPHYLETVSTYCPGPVEIVSLCFPDTGRPDRRRRLRPGRRVTIFGVINENKQPIRVLRTLASLGPSFESVELHLAGAVDETNRQRLIAEAKSLDLPPPLFHDYVSDSKLQQILENSHAICCLRYPVTEGGSASLVTALYRARPLIVSDIASYSLVPDDLVYKVSYGTSQDDLADALRRIFEDPAEAEDRAARAGRWAGNQFSAFHYVDALEPILLSIGKHATLSRIALDLIPAVTTPRHEPMLAAVSAFAEVLDWMHISQIE